MIENNSSHKSLRIAVLVPCFNEESTIRKVVEDFHTALPEAIVYVFDNGSSDKTAKIAVDAGAKVCTVIKKGKGNVVNAMFRLIDADIYLMVDGDDTYFASDARKLIDPIVQDKADLVIGDRISSNAYDRENTRRFHGFGNRLVRWLINKQYQQNCHDILSGYRAFSRFYVCNFPVMSEGFEIETEITLHTLDKRLRFIEVPINYQERPTGSESKLNTISDGVRIIKTITLLFKNYQPMVFFSLLAFIIALGGLFVGVFPVYEYIQTQFITRVPLAILAASLEIVAMLLFCCGLILDTAVRQHREVITLRMMDYHKKGNGLNAR